MANRRLFSLDIVDTDAFTEMPLSTQALYFHIAMRCDDDGFCANPKKIIKTFNASIRDLKTLITKKFILECENGVVVVKHWWIHNLKRKDRYKRSNYLSHNPGLKLDENGAYTYSKIDDGNQMATKWQPSGNQVATQDKISKDKISKDNKIEIDKSITELMQNPLTQELYKAGYINTYDFEEYDTLLNLYVDEYGMKDVKIKVRYFINQVVKHKNENGSLVKYINTEIDNRFLYFKKSMEGVLGYDC